MSPAFRTIQTDGKKPVPSSLYLPRSMSIAKTIEVSSQSTAGFSEAAQAAITEVSRTVNNVKHVWVESFEMVVQDDGSFIYRTHCKVTFVVGPDGAG